MKRLFVLMVVSLSLAAHSAEEQKTPIEPTERVKRVSDPILDKAVLRCSTIGFKSESNEFRKCVLDQVALLSDVMLRQERRSSEKVSAEQDSSRKPVRVAPRLNARNSPNASDFYPPAAKNANISGVVTVRVCVDPSGKISGDPTVTNSSNHPILDRAAIKWSRAAIFSPGTIDGVPALLCAAFNVRFGIETAPPVPW